MVGSGAFIYPRKRPLDIDNIVSPRAFGMSLNAHCLGVSIVLPVEMEKAGA